MARINIRNTPNGISLEKPARGTKGDVRKTYCCFGRRVRIGGCALHRNSLNQIPKNLNIASIDLCAL